MSIYRYEEAFGAWDKTTGPMRRAISQWFSLFYGDKPDAEQDNCQRVAYTVVTKLSKTVFGEYHATAREPFVQQVLSAMDACRRSAMQLAMVGGECYMKPCPTDHGFSFTLIPRDQVLIFGRDGAGEPVDLGTVEHSVRENAFYTLLERRTVDTEGYLTIDNRLYRSLNQESLGTRVPLHSHPAYEKLADHYRYERPVGSVGLIRLKTPVMNCVDGSPDGVSIYAAAAELIRNIDRNEAQMNGEFLRGQSRILASADLLQRDGQGRQALTDHLFVGLDEDPEQVGITVFSPPLREQSYLARKQEYLRNAESIIGLKRGMLSDANVEDRTATEIAASAGDYSLTVMELQAMWEQALNAGTQLCAALSEIFHGGRAPEDRTVYVDWGNGVLYDEDRQWEQYCRMVQSGLLKPEIALGWRFNMQTETEEQLRRIRQKYMPNQD